MTDFWTSIADFIKTLIDTGIDVFTSVGMPPTEAKLLSILLISILVIGILSIPLQLLHKHRGAKK